MEDNQKEYILKVTRVGGQLSLYIPKNICNSEGLEFGSLVRVTIKNTNLKGHSRGAE